MVVAIYPLPSGSWSFARSSARPTRVRVPRGSVLRLTKLFGYLLFIPSTGDPLQLLPWSASQVFDEAGKGDAGFQLQNRATGPLARRCAG